MREELQLARRIPLAVVVTIVLQTAAGLIWAGAAEERLDAVERVVEARAGGPERLARVEEQVAAVRAQLERMEAKLDALSMRGRDG